MNWYYITFFLTYHSIGLYNFYKDSMLKDTREGITRVKKYMKAASTVMQNTGIVSMAAFYLFSILISPSVEVFSRRLEMIRLLFSFCLLDILIYITHKLFHSSILYGYHEKNHSVYKPPGWLTAYTSSLDWVLGTLLPCALPVWVTGMHYYTVYLWIFLLNLGAVHNLNPRKYLHHLLPDTNFGISIFMDKMLQTL